MKKFTALLLTSLIIFGITGCTVIYRPPQGPKNNRIYDILKESKGAEYDKWLEKRKFHSAETFAKTQLKDLIKTLSTYDINLAIKKIPTGAKKLYFGITPYTPKEFYETLDDEDFTIREKDGELYVVGGSDYALKKAVETLKEEIKKDNVTLPIDYKAPESEQVLRLRAGTYNIQSGDNFDHDFSLLAKDITDSELDLVGLQEVDENTTRNKNQDTMKYLADHTELKYYKFVKNVDYYGGGYGTGILSRYPIESFEIIPLEVHGLEPRSYSKAVLNVNGVKVTMFNTHLTWETDNKYTVQREQMKVLAKAFSGIENAVLMGDFNDNDIDGYRPYYPNCPMANGDPVFFNSCPGYGSFDNVIISPNGVALKKAMAYVPQLSDHYLVWMEFVFTGINKK